VHGRVPRQQAQHRFRLHHEVQRLMSDDHIG
jgi:hypothetical protein